MILVDIDYKEVDMRKGLRRRIYIDNSPYKFDVIGRVQPSPYKEATHV